MDKKSTFKSLSHIGWLKIKWEQIGMDFGDINFQTRFSIVSRCYMDGSCLRVLAQKSPKVRIYSPPARQRGGTILSQASQNLTSLAESSNLAFITITSWCDADLFFCLNNGKKGVDCQHLTLPLCFCPALAYIRL